MFTWNEFRISCKGMNAISLSLMISSFVLGITVRADDLCGVFQRPQDFAHKLVSVHATVRPTMHGTFLLNPRCEGSLLLVLPEEISHYGGAVRTAKDGAFDRFAAARFDFRPEATPFEATFSGQVETAKRGRGFGYYRNLRTRFVLGSVHLDAVGRPRE